MRREKERKRKAKIPQGMAASRGVGRPQEMDHPQEVPRCPQQITRCPLSRGTVRRPPRVFVDPRRAGTPGSADQRGAVRKSRDATACASQRRGASLRPQRARCPGRRPRCQRAEPRRRSGGRWCRSSSRRLGMGGREAAGWGRARGGGGARHLPRRPRGEAVWPLTPTAAPPPGGVVRGQRRRPPAAGGGGTCLPHATPGWPGRASAAATRRGQPPRGGNGAPTRARSWPMRWVGWGRPPKWLCFFY